MAYWFAGVILVVSTQIVSIQASTATTGVWINIKQEGIV